MATSETLGSRSRRKQHGYRRRDAGPGERLLSPEQAPPPLATVASLAPRCERLQPDVCRGGFASPFALAARQGEGRAERVEDEMVRFGLHRPGDWCRVPRMRTRMCLRRRSRACPRALSRQSARRRGSRIRLGDFTHDHTRRYRGHGYTRDAETLLFGRGLCPDREHRRSHRADRLQELEPSRGAGTQEQIRRFDVLDHTHTVFTYDGTWRMLFIRHRDEAAGSGVEVVARGSSGESGPPSCAAQEPICVRSAALDGAYPY